MPGHGEIRHAKSMDASYSRFQKTGLVVASEGAGGGCEVGIA
jgi:hypothetical protein